VFYSLISKKEIDVFSTFINIHVATKNDSRISLRFSTHILEPSQKNSMSSINRRCEIKKEPPIYTPSKVPTLFSTMPY
jgi:hypothetical protein